MDAAAAQTALGRRAPHKAGEFSMFHFEAAEDVYASRRRWGKG